ncbi:hypothetical protein AA0Z99_00215 [Agrococcus sp. 1P02AA]|uniref:hypothetical protein n=1 Tax=Agrococcus sp. 1P02AA TaxID=3132259 RepID=UPI0039A6C8B2
MSDRQERLNEQTADQHQRAIRIGRLASDEGATPDEAHAIADCTAVLAQRERARLEREVRPKWLTSVLGATLAVLVFRLGARVVDEGIALDASMLWSLAVIAFIAHDLFLGSVISRIATLLPARIASWTAVDVRLVVMRAYNGQRDILGMRGCDCSSHQAG